MNPKIYLVDSTFLIGLFNIKKRNLTSPEYQNVERWIKSITNEPRNKLVTSAICIAEIVRIFFFEYSLAIKDIRLWMSFLRNGMGIEILEFDYNQIAKMIENLNGVQKGSIHIGEMSLLSYINDGYETVFVSSDGGPLKCFESVKRCNPEKGDKEYQIGEPYSNPTA